MRRLAFLMKILTLAAFAPAALAAPASAQTPRRILVYGDSNTWGYEASADGAPARRYPRDVRWPGVLAQVLGPDFEVVEDGLNLRTTDLNGPAEPSGFLLPEAVNGAVHLPTAIASQMPLDLVVIMLGTNDLQARHARSADEAATAALALADTVRRSAGGIGNAYPAPRVLVVAPPRIGTLPIPAWAENYAGGPEKSRDFSEAFRRRAAAAEVPLVDAAEVIGGAAHGVDGLHLDADDHARLGRAIAARVAALLETKD